MQRHIMMLLGLVAMLAAGLFLWQNSERTASSVPLIEPKSEPAISRGTAASGPSVAKVAPTVHSAPERHERELAAVKGADDDPAAFERALADGNTELAADILDAVFRRTPQQPQAAFELLQPRMDRYPFLWQDSILVMGYWAACVELGCEPSVMRQLEVNNPSYYHEHATCLNAASVMMQLVKTPKTADRQARLAAADEALDVCLSEHPAPDQNLVTQVQLYLSYLKSLFGPEAAEKHAADLTARYRGLPPLPELLPKR